MDPKFDAIIKTAVSDLQDVIPLKMDIDKVIIQHTQEGLTISSDGFLITLPPKVTDAIKLYFQTKLGDQ